MKTKLQLAALALAFLSTINSELSTIHAQGSLTPPAGAPAPVMKSLDQIEARTPLTTTTTPGTANCLFRITQPGSYFLTGNLSVPANFHGIVIATNGVTLDLGGFVITGQSNSLDGVSVDNDIRSLLVVRHGTIRKMGDNGVTLFAINASGCLVEISQVTVSECLGSGIRSPGGIVRDCLLIGNDSSGISVLNGAALVENCMAYSNRLGGITAAGGVISRCHVGKSPNFYGIQITSGLVVDCSVANCREGITTINGDVSHCRVTDCTFEGITLNYDSRATGNTVDGTGIGIRIVGSGSRAENNNIVNQTTGVSSSDPNNLIIGNSFRGCTTALNTVAGNRVGTLLTGTSAAAINGNTGGGLGTSDPYANVIY